MNVQDRIQKEHFAIIRHPKACAFAGIIACGKVEITESIPTACTDGWNVKYNPKFIEKHAPDASRLRFLILHEAMHKAYRHLHVWKALHDENAMLANIAADHFVNLALQDMDAGSGWCTMLAVGIQPEPKYRNWSVRQIFEDLKQQQQKGGDKGDKGGEGMDDHDWDGASERSAEETERLGKEIEQAIRQGEIIRRKLAGKGQGGADGVFGDILAPKVDWRKALRDFVQETCAGRDESTWARPHRRFIAEDVYMPSMVGITLRELAVVFDVSGSVFGSSEMTRFVTELSSIIETVRPSKTHVLYVDTAVQGHQVFEDGQFAVADLKVKGGGGTDLPVAYDYLAQKGIKPEACVILTDMYTPFGTQPAYPVLWAATTDTKAPYGVTLEIGE